MQGEVSRNGDPRRRRRFLAVPCLTVPLLLVIVAGVSGLHAEGARHEAVNAQSSTPPEEPTPTGR